MKEGTAPLFILVFTPDEGGKKMSNTLNGKIIILQFPRTIVAPRYELHIP